MQRKEQKKTEVGRNHLWQGAAICLTSATGSPFSKWALQISLILAKSKLVTTCGEPKSKFTTCWASLQLDFVQETAISYWHWLQKLRQKQNWGFDGNLTCLFLFKGWPTDLKTKHKTPPQDLALDHLSFQRNNISLQQEQICPNLKLQMSNAHELGLGCILQLQSPSSQLFVVAGGEHFTAVSLLHESKFVGRLLPSLRLRIWQQTTNRYRKDPWPMITFRNPHSNHPCVSQCVWWPALLLPRSSHHLLPPL